MINGAQVTRKDLVKISNQKASKRLQFHKLSRELRTYTWSKT